MQIQKDFEIMDALEFSNMYRGQDYKPVLRYFNSGENMEPLHPDSNVWEDP